MGKDKIDLTLFKDIPDYEDYCINNKGEVYSKKSKKILSYYLSKKDKSRIVDICKNSKYKSIHIDVLVSKLFPKQFEELNNTKEHPIYKNLYISPDGIIYSVKKFNNTIYYVNKMSQCLSCGYLTILYNREGIRKTLKVHRLVAETFIPNPNNYSIINHKDENKINNNVNNLEWCSAKYNINYGTRTKRQCETQGYKITLINNKDNIIKKFISINECARYLNTSSYAINYSIKHNVPYKNKYNFIIKYE